MPQIDLTDGTLFGNDAGEDEQPDILNSYFVDQPSFNQFLSRTNSFRVARSRKGMGKSALLAKQAYDLSQDQSPPIIIKITGTNLIGLIAPVRNDTHLQSQNYWYRVILSYINLAVADAHKFTFSDRNNAMVTSAEIPLIGRENITSSLIRRIVSQKIPIEGIYDSVSGGVTDFADLFRTVPPMNVWLMVDDIDSTYVDTEELQILTSTFFSACRALVRDMKGLFIRASVRTDVWSSLRKNEDLDKCEQYVTDIQWSAKDMEVILSKKIYSYFQRRDANSIEIINLDYRKDTELLLEKTFTKKIKWGGVPVQPFRPLYILSAGRPRWMSQLCRLAGVQAAKNRTELISTREIEQVSKDYSRYRLSDIFKEHSHQYADLQKLIESFSNSPARYSTNDLLSQIAANYTNHVGAGNIPFVDGTIYSRPLQLAHFIYKIGFIVGRKENNPDGTGASFVRYEERPELLWDQRNPDDNLLWEVHPSYRYALTIGRDRRAARGAERARRSAPPKQTNENSGPSESRLVVKGGNSYRSRRPKK